MAMTEQKTTVAIFQHVLHRLNDFFSSRPVGQYEDAPEVGAAFFEFCGQKDARLALENETTLRRLLWEHHECPPHHRYGDDGELQCSCCMIDFKRTSVSRISEHFLQMKMKKLIEAKPK